MFQVSDSREGKRVRIFATGLAILSLVALTVTAWILFNVRREEEIVAKLIQHLPESDLAAAQELSGDLRLQSGLSALLVLNLVGTAIAFAMVMQRYVSSERSLRDVKVLATDILASMDAAVITTDRSGRLTSINPRGLDLIEGSKNALGQPLSDLGDEHQLLSRICQEVLKHHNTIRDHDYSIERNGQRKSLRTSCTLLKDQRNEEIGTVIQLRDVSERVLMEDRLRRMERFMGLGSLASGLHHEIKNPLSALLLHIQLLAERLSTMPADPQAEELLDVVQTEVTRINDVLEGFRNYASVTMLGRGPVDVPALIEKLIRLLRPQAEQQDVVISFECSDHNIGIVEADSVRIEQVLLNLALNALAAMPSGGELKFSVFGEADSLFISVADSGQGIPAAIQSQIFDPYFTTKSDGTGLGLALCDKIIRQHDGSIDFSTSRAGTEFVIQLPMEQQA